MHHPQGPASAALRLRAIVISLALALGVCAGCGQGPGERAVAGDAGGNPEALGFPTDSCPGFVIDEGEFTVQPGQDINFCVRIPMPAEFQNRPLALGGWAWELANTHHFFMEYSPHPFPGPGTDPVPCPSYSWNASTSKYDFVPNQKPEGTFSLIGSANNEGSKILFGAGQGKNYVMLNSEYGRYMPQDGHFRTSHHLINPTNAPITTHARFKVCVKDAATTPFLATSLVCTTTAINVPANTTGTASATCVAPFDLDLVLLASHAHAHLTRFTMQQYDGTQTLPDLIYDSRTWDSPNIVNLSQPLHLKQGQGITYTCEYTGPAVYRDNTEMADAEHCAIFTAYSYPTAHPGLAPPQLTGLATSPAQVSTAFMSLSTSPI
jgi:hypothetical protein